MGVLENCRKCIALGRSHDLKDGGGSPGVQERRPGGGLTSSP
eukprot:CAMPEP_0175277174 /NCGR_PEP_ID=MMETSP0093-20121207/48870_1 /TAXON_ID=311494 /ORGANISM="Alexandrium monilatum, Strain CCMP3105" /LENGTH=41 /DNA_ID= /DNA_START= /DNA_END= /DNA_ORIENTATION=